MSFSQLRSIIMPYIVAGISIVLTILAIIILSSVLLWGALIGIIIFTVAYIKNRFFPSKPRYTHDTVRTSQRQESSQGRIIEHEDD